MTVSAFANAAYLDGWKGTHAHFEPAKSCPALHQKPLRGQRRSRNLSTAPDTNCLVTWDAGNNDGHALGYLEASVREGDPRPQKALGLRSTCLETAWTTASARAIHFLGDQGLILSLLGIRNAMGFFRDLYGTPLPLYLAAFAAVALVQLRAARVDLRAWRQQLKQRIIEAVKDPASSRSKPRAETPPGHTEASADQRHTQRPAQPSTSTKGPPR
jgi:hypothetical protein